MSHMRSSKGGANGSNGPPMGANGPPKKCKWVFWEGHMASWEWCANGPPREGHIYMASWEGHMHPKMPRMKNLINTVENAPYDVPDAHMSHLPECKWDKWAPKEGHMALLKRGIWPSEKGFVGGLLGPYVTGPGDKWVK